MEGADFTKTMVPFYQTTRYHTQEHRNLHIHNQYTRPANNQLESLQFILLIKVRLIALVLLSGHVFILKMAVTRSSETVLFLYQTKRN
jgi:hypothetical protein